MVLIDHFFFLIFSLTSLFYWVPVFLILFIPFILARRMKNDLKGIACRIEKFSEKKLGEFRRLRRMIMVGARMERKTKGLYNRFINRAYQKTVWWQRMEIIEAVPRRSRVLDIGCGNGFLAQLIAKNKQAEVTCVDVEDFNQTDLPTVLFDGVSLPFEDKEFDIVVLSYVLHHSQLQKQLLLEAARVCRGKIIIYEDETVLGAEKIMAMVHSRVWNFLNAGLRPASKPRSRRGEIRGLSNQKGEVLYHSPGEWRNIFEEQGLEVVEEERKWGVGSLVIPLKRAIFVLKNKN